MKNEFETRGEITAIFLKKKDGSFIETLINTSDLPKVNAFQNSWYPTTDRSGSIYVFGHAPKSEKGRKTEQLHRWIFDNPKGYVVDHINHDTLNNTRSNLRVIKQFQNAHNTKGAQKSSKSGIRGVFWNKRMERWQAQIRINGKRIHIGTFNDISEAERAVKEEKAKHKDLLQLI